MNPLRQGIYTDISLAKSGHPDKFREISTAAMPEDRIFGDSCGLHR